MQTSIKSRLSISKQTMSTRVSLHTSKLRSQLRFKGLLPDNTVNGNTIQLLEFRQQNYFVKF